jgi:uncharacterized protein YjbI with pentapeptide repeats
VQLGSMWQPPYFGGVNFEGADLTGSEISWATFENSNLASANLSGATFFASKFNHAEFRNGCDLRNTKFIVAPADSAFVKSRFDGAKINPATWRDLVRLGADLTGAQPVP